MSYIGLIIPFMGTALGSACVFLLKDELPHNIQKNLTGFAAGVMVAASIWSLLDPSIDINVVKAFIGFWIGTLFLLLLDELIPHLHMFTSIPEGRHSKLSKTMMMVLAVTIHNIPEGMAVGVVYSAYLQQAHSVSFSSVLALTLGIAIQNFPEGAIISLPLHTTQNETKLKSFLYGVLSGAVEPIGAIFVIIFSSLATSLLPYLLSFASGAMMYVVVEELIPEMSEGKHSNLTTISFTIGFTLMMVLDVFMA